MPKPTTLAAGAEPMLPRMKATLTVYAPKHSIAEALAVQPGPTASAEFFKQVFITDERMRDVWIELGVATVTVDCYPRAAITAKQVDILREQLRQHRVEAEQAEQTILAQISNLLALTNEA